MTSIKERKMTVNKYSLIGVLAITLCILMSISLVGITAQKEPIGEETYQAVVQFYQYDKDIPLEARVISEGQWQEEFEKLGYPVKSREKIVFTEGYGDWVPGYLAFPQTGSPPYPRVLQTHGFDNRKVSWWEDDSFCWGGLLSRELLSAGFTLLALDMQCHGERKANNDYESPMPIYLQKHMNKLGAVFIESVIDYRRAIDYLETRPEIDIDWIGVIGYNFGGGMTYVLTAVEPRIKVAVACVGGPFKEYTTWGAFHFASHFGARPFLLLYGRLDKPHRVEGAQELLDLIDSPTKELVFYDSEHRLPAEYVNKAAEWFKEYLK